MVDDGLINWLVKGINEFEYWFDWIDWLIELRVNKNAWEIQFAIGPIKI